MGFFQLLDNITVYSTTFCCPLCVVFVMIIILLFSSKHSVIYVDRRSWGHRFAEVKINTYVLFFVECFV